jgi:hypothetical protein
MSVLIIAAAIGVALAIGFGLGRVKNAKKLKAVSDVIARAEAALASEASVVEAKVKAEALTIVADIKKHL